MIKSQHEVLCNLKALHLSVIANENSREFRRGYILALLAMATHWDVEKEFLEYVKKLGPGTVEIEALPSHTMNNPNGY
jgi:hypothetical protein